MQKYQPEETVWVTGSMVSCGSEIDSVGTVESTGRDSPGSTRVSTACGVTTVSVTEAASVTCIWVSEVPPNGWKILQRIRIPRTTAPEIPRTNRKSLRIEEVCEVLDIVIFLQMSFRNRGISGSASIGDIFITTSGESKNGKSKNKVVHVFPFPLLGM
jgi:hypothetical protein